MTRRAERLLAAAYPPPVRRRWGGDLAGAIEAAGPAGWTDTLLGAGRLWLRPVRWPAGTERQVRRAAVAVATAAVGGTALTVRGTAAALGPAAYDVVVAGLLVALAGLGLLCPVPRRTRAAWWALGRAAVRPAGALVAAAGLVAAELAWLDTAGGAVHAVAVAGYWAALTVAALSPTVVLSAVDPGRLHTPGRARLRGGLVLVTLGLVVAAAGETTSVAGSRPSVVLVVLPTVLLVVLLAGLTGAALVDLDRRVQDRPR